MIQNNYNGIQSFQSSFDDSDLYNSRFIKARLVNTSFRNCNLKKTHFCDIEQENVSFKMSNTREAIFDNQESELFADLGGTEFDYNVNPYGDNVINIEQPDDSIVQMNFYDWYNSVVEKEDRYPHLMPTKIERR